MKKLKLREEDRVSPEERAEIFANSTMSINGGPHVSMAKVMAEMAYQPPAQTDAFTPALTLDDAGKRLLSFFERIERLDEERQALVNDIAEVFNEAKGEGFDTKAMKALLKIRGDEGAEAKLAMLKLYHDRVGMRIWPV